VGFSQSYLVNKIKKEAINGVSICTMHFVKKKEEEKNRLNILIESTFGLKEMR
jgi:hypothetical protein